MQKHLIISSQNAGYVARVSCAFEKAGLRHRLDVEAGTMKIVVPPSQYHMAKRVVVENDLEESVEPPTGCNHMHCLDQDELLACIEDPSGFTADELIAAMHLYNMRELEGKKAMRMCALLDPLPAFRSGRPLTIGSCIALVMFTLLIPPFALLLTLFMFLHKRGLRYLPPVSSFTTRSRQFAFSILLFSSAATLLLTWQLSNL